MEIAEIVFDSRQPWESVTLPGSKSIAARALILRFIYRYLRNVDVELKGIPNCDDTRELKRELSRLENSLRSGSVETYSLGAGGTSLRFFLALVASIPGFEGYVDCALELRRRPIVPLIEALRQAGADLTFNEAEVYPIHVKGRKLCGNAVTVRGSVSSQFMSALMMASLLWKTPLCAPMAKEKETVSRPYVAMTREVMHQFELLVGCAGGDSDKAPLFHIEGDWSAAAFFYEFALLCPDRVLRLCNLPRIDCSLQGDSRCVELFGLLGVKTDDSFAGNRQRADETCLCIQSKGSEVAKMRSPEFVFRCDMSDTPDMVPPLAVGMCLTGIRFVLAGVRNLRFKESDRIASLVIELGKLGYCLEASEDTLEWHGDREERQGKREDRSLKPDAKKPLLDAHGDHRIAMALTIAAVKLGKVRIQGLSSIHKSFPDFLNQISRIGLGLLTGLGPLTP